jgi:aminopeptidase N
MILNFRGFPQPFLKGALSTAKRESAFSRPHISFSVRPLHYFIFINPNLKTDRFYGREKIDLNFLKPAKKIALNSLNLKIQKVMLTDPISKVKFFVDPKAQTLLLVFSKPIKKGIHILKISWEGKLKKKPMGFFYVPLKKKRTVLLSTQFEPASARRMFPCWDNPDFKATFQISAEIPRSFSAVSNMPVKTTTLFFRKKIMVFAPSPKMSTYLVELTIGKLESITGKSDGIQIRVITPEGEQNSGEYALHAAEKDLHYDDQYFGYHYPLPKLDLIAVPEGFGGAMENWGAITFNPSLLLLNPHSHDLKPMIFEFISHEIAHQWTGDLVTMKWWNNIWLNEGFANWLMQKETRHFNPQWHIRLTNIYYKNETMTEDSFKAARPVKRKVLKGRFALDAFTPIIYRKAQAILRMLELYLGRKTFQKGVDLYIHRFQYSSTNAQDLWKSLGKASGKPVSSMAERWIVQPGFPQVFAKTSCSGNREVLILRESRFSFSPAAKNYFWKTPIFLTLSTNLLSEKKILLWKKKKILFKPDTCGSLVLFRHQGYYRIHYNSALFRSMLKNFNQLSSIRKINFLNDTWAFLENDEYPTKNYFNLICKFRNSTNPAPWKEILKQFQFIDRLEVKASSRKRFKDFAVRFLTPLYQKLKKRKKWKDNPGILRLRKKLSLFLARFKNEKPAGIEKFSGCMKNLTLEEKKITFSATSQKNPIKMAETVLRTARAGHPEQAWKFVKIHQKFFLKNFSNRNMALFYLYLIKSFYGNKKANDIFHYAQKQIPSIYKQILFKGEEYNHFCEKLKKNLLPKLNVYIANEKN